MTGRLARFSLAIILCLASLSLAAAGRPLAPRTIAPTANFVFNPVTAFAGGRFLTIWRESMGFLGDPIMGAFSDANGARLSERSFPLGIPPVNDAFSYDLVSTGDAFTLFWVDDDRRTFMADVDLEGHVTNHRIAGIPWSINTRIAWNGTHFLAVTQTNGRPTGVVTMFDRDGRAVLPPVAFPGEAFYFDIAVVDGRFVMLRSDFDAVVAHTVTPQGLGERMRTNAPTGVTYRPSRIVATPAANGDLLVLWGTEIGQQGELRSAILRADGSRTAEVVVTGGAAGIVPLEVLRTGNGYLVAYTEAGRLLRVLLDAAGARAGEPELVQQPFVSNLSAAAGGDTILVPFNTTAAALGPIATLAITAGNKPQPEIVSAGYSRQLQPVLAEGGDNLLATWTEIAGDATFVRATSVSDEGEPGEPVHVADGVLATAETPWNNAGSFMEDSHHLVVYQDDNHLLATRVTDSGTVTPPIVIAEVAASAEAAVVWVDSRWVVVWTDGSVLRSLTVSRDGVASATRLLEVHAPLPEGWLRFVRSPRLAYDGGDVLLVWREVHRDPDDDLPPVGGGQPTRTWAIQLTKTGLPPTGPPLELELDGPSLSVASSGFDFAVVAGQHARILKGDGPLRVTASRELFPWPAVSDVTWDRNHYDVALRYFGANTDWYLAVIPFDGNGNVTGTGRVTSTLPPDFEVAPSIARAGFGALIGVQEGTIDDGFDATVYREQDFAFMPSPPSPPRNVHVRQLSSTEFEVSWDAPAGGDPGSYIVEQFLNGTWTVVARVAGNVRRANVITNGSAPIVRVRAFNAAGPSEPAEHGGSGRSRRRAVR